MSIVYVFAWNFTIVLNCVLLRDYENILMEIYNINLLNIKVKTHYYHIYRDLDLFTKIKKYISFAYFFLFHNSNNLE